MSTNCYLIDNNNHSILIDPGDKAELLINYLTQNNLQLTAILLTHGHFDHIGAIDELVEKYNCPVYIHQDDYEMIYHVIFSGDVLFKNGIGRFDFPTSSSTDTRNSIKKIKEIKDDYEIYPGHGELTTLIQEKLNNPYLQ